MLCIMLGVIRQDKQFFSSGLILTAFYFKAHNRYQGVYSFIRTICNYGEIFGAVLGSSKSSPKDQP